MQELKIGVLLYIFTFTAVIKCAVLKNHVTSCFVSPVVIK